MPTAIPTSSTIEEVVESTGSHLPGIDSTTSSIVLLVGMAVGIDYSLFYLRRTREERAAGHDTTEALRIAAGTSGRAIVVSGLTVMVALAGLFLTGIDEFDGIGVASVGDDETVGLR